MENADVTVDGAIEHVVSREMDDIDIQLQGQEHIYTQTLLKEKGKAGRHTLDEVGRSLNAIAQRRRQYFLDYKICNTVRSVRQWYGWETKRNHEANSHETRNENAATRGIKTFLHRLDFYATLLARFDDYILRPLMTHFSTSKQENPELEEVKEQMKNLKRKCDLMLNDDEEITLENENHSDYEKRFPVISVLPWVHDILNKMVTLSFQWRLHARYEQQFEQISGKRNFTESEKDLNDKRKVLRNLDHQIRKTQRSNELLEEEIHDRRKAMTSSNFSEQYARCMGRIDEVRRALDHCRTNIHNTDTTIKTVQQSLGKYKVVGPKKKLKLESSILKRSRKVEELSKIQAELDRLEDQKMKLEEEEMAWLRGGYENAMGIIENLKEQSLILQQNLLLLEKEKADLKTSYDQSMQQVLLLSNNFQLLTHKYEYVKRLASAALKTLYSGGDPLVVVKPNKVSLHQALSEDAYVMIQPKGVAMVIHNKLKKKTAAPGRSKTSKSPASTRKEPGKTMDALCMQLGYYVIQRSDLSVSAIKQHMVGLSDQYHGYQGDHNSLLVLMAAQANEKGRVIDDNGEAVAVADLLQHFNPSRCPSLIGKPKIFLLLLKITSEQRPSIIDDVTSQSSRRKTALSLDTETMLYFEPEPISVEDDFLVARVLYKDDADLEEEPTFGGINSASSDEIPWFAAHFIKSMADLAGSKDLLSLLNNMKRSFLDQVLTARSTATSSDKDSIYSYFPLHRKASEKSGRVNIFIDHALKKKLYIMPGI